MVETTRKLHLRDFLLSITNVKDYTPDETASVIQEYSKREKHREFLNAVLANHPDREALALALADRLTEEREGAYCAGIRHGYKLAEGLAKLEKKGKEEQKPKAKTWRVLMENPKATNKEICRALDNADIRLHKSKSTPNDARRWSDVVNIPYYKNFISRVRKQVARATILRRWEDMMDIVDKDIARGLDYADDLYGDRLKRPKS
jgi:hypothetical protein